MFITGLFEKAIIRVYFVPLSKYDLQIHCSQCYIALRAIRRDMRLQPYLHHSRQVCDTYGSVNGQSVCFLELLPLFY
jgi:hypothetical protein